MNSPSQSSHADNASYKHSHRSRVALMSNACIAITFVRSSESSASFVSSAASSNDRVCVCDRSSAASIASGHSATTTLSFICDHCGNRNICSGDGGIKLSSLNNGFESSTRTRDIFGEQHCAAEGDASTPISGRSVCSNSITANTGIVTANAINATTSTTTTVTTTAITTSASSTSSPTTTSTGNEIRECVCRQPINCAGIFEEFVRENMLYTCFMLPNNSLSKLDLIGFIYPAILLVTGRPETLKLLCSLWRRRMLKAPLGYTIRSLGQTSLLEMTTISQAQFTPLAEALHRCVDELNSLQADATFDAVIRRLRAEFSTMELPAEEILKASLAGLVAENKLSYDYRRQVYCATRSLLTPWQEFESLTLSDTTGNGSRAFGDRETEDEIIDLDFRHLEEKQANDKKQQHSEPLIASVAANRANSLLRIYSSKCNTLSTDTSSSKEEYFNDGVKRSPLRRNSSLSNEIDRVNVANRKTSANFKRSKSFKLNHSHHHNAHLEGNNQQTEPRSNGCACDENVIKRQSLLSKLLKFGHLSGSVKTRSSSALSTTSVSQAHVGFQFPEESDNGAVIPYNESYAISQVELRSKGTQTVKCGPEDVVTLILKQAGRHALARNRPSHHPHHHLQQQQQQQHNNNDHHHHHHNHRQHAAEQSVCNDLCCANRGATASSNQKCLCENVAFSMLPSIRHRNMRKSRLHRHYTATTTTTTTSAADSEHDTAVDSSSADKCLCHLLLSENGGEHQSSFLSSHNHRAHHQMRNKYRNGKLRSASMRHQQLHHHHHHHRPTNEWSTEYDSASCNGTFVVPNVLSQRRHRVTDKHQFNHLLHIRRRRRRVGDGKFVSSIVHSDGDQTNDDDDDGDDARQSLRRMNDPSFLKNSIRTRSMRNGNTLPVIATNYNDYDAQNGGNHANGKINELYIHGNNVHGHRCQLEPTDHRHHHHHQDEPDCYAFGNGSRPSCGSLLINNSVNLKIEIEASSPPTTANVSTNDRVVVVDGGEVSQSIGSQQSASNIAIAPTFDAPNTKHVATIKMLRNEGERDNNTSVSQFANDIYSELTFDNQTRQLSKVNAMPIRPFAGEFGGSGSRSVSVNRMGVEQYNSMTSYNPDLNYSNSIVALKEQIARAKANFFNAPLSSTTATASTTQ